MCVPCMLRLMCLHRRQKHGKHSQALILAVPLPEFYMRAKAADDWASHMSSCIAAHVQDMAQKLQQQTKVVYRC